MLLLHKILLISPAVLTAVGDILIGLAIFKVHEKLEKEKKVDKEVIREMHHEKKYVIIGVVLILFGLALDSIFKLNRGYF